MSVMELKLPRVGMNMTEAPIIAWFKRPGQPIARGEALFEIETDKVTYQVEAEVEGELLEILVAEGQIAQVGQVVGRISAAETVEAA